MKPRPLAPVQYVAPIAFGTSLLVVLGPLQAGDVVRSLRLDAGSAANGILGPDNPQMAVYANSDRPTTTAAAANGRTLIKDLSVPSVPHLCDPTAAGVTVSAQVSLVIPLLFVSDKETRYISLVFAQNNAPYNGLASLEVERPEEDQQ